MNASGNRNFRCNPPRFSMCYSSATLPDSRAESTYGRHGGVDKAAASTRASTTSIGTVSSQRSLFPGESRAENFTPEGLFEDQVQIEDRLRAGSAEFIVTQPRTPCFKLRVRFNRPEMVKRFLESKRTRFYLAVLREGEVAASDLIQFTERQEEGGVTIFDIVNLYTLDSENEDLLRRAAELCALPHGRKDCFPNAFGMPTRNYRFMSGLKTGAAADALRAAISLQLSSTKLLLFRN